MRLMQGYSGKGQEAMMGAGKIAIDAIENIRTVASLNKEKHFIEEYMTLIGKPHKSVLDIGILNN